MTWFPDMSPFDTWLTGDIRAIGWLEATHPYSRGPVPRDFLERLEQFQNLAGECAEALSLPGGLGSHDCEFCPELSTVGWVGTEIMGHGHIGVPQGRILFLAPQMLFHYVAEHDYSPPVEFVNAVMECPLPGTEAYLAAVQPFLLKPRDR